MQTYEIRYPDADAEETTLRFEANDACDALLILQKQGTRKRAELWENGKKLCQLARTRVDGDDIWIVGQEV